MIFRCVCCGGQRRLLCLFFRQATAYDEVIANSSTEAPAMTTELPESTRLLPGQTLRMAVDAGFTLLVAEGCVNVISPPTWFGETIFNLKTPLNEGDAHVVERGGWIEIRALSPARVGAVPRPAAPTAASASRVARLLQLLGAGAAWR